MIVGNSEDGEDVSVVPELDLNPEEFPPLEEKPEEDTSDTPINELPVIVEDKEVLPFKDLTNARSANPQAFIQQVGPMAQQVAGGNDLYASIMIAQAILESGWGQSLFDATSEQHVRYQRQLQWTICGDANSGR
ncbi:hypothetical protein PSH13_09175 [Enterococcus casseliflavus]|nr:hypothetical protein [Enterococcus casseliflavus]